MRKFDNTRYDDAFATVTDCIVAKPLGNDLVAPPPLVELQSVKALDLLPSHAGVAVVAFLHFVAPKLV